MKKIWSVAIRGRPVRTTEQQNNRTTDRTRIGQDKLLPDNSSERFVAADKRKTDRKYLNLILDDFYICKGKLKVYKDICPTLLSEREGLKVVMIYEQKILHGKNGRS